MAWLRSPGRPPGRGWYASSSELLALVAREARALALDPNAAPLTLAAVAGRLGRGRRTLQEAMAAEGLGWPQIKADTLAKYSRISRAKAA